MELTLFEVHVPEAQFNAPFAGSEPRSPGEDEPAEADASERRSAKAGPLVVLAAFVGLALLARYLRGGEAEPATIDEVEA